MLEEHLWDVGSVAEGAKRLARTSSSNNRKGGEGPQPQLEAQLLGELRVRGGNTAGRLLVLAATC
jgi:hypothetical protein